MRLLTDCAYELQLAMSWFLQVTSSGFFGLTSRKKHFSDNDSRALFLLKSDLLTLAYLIIGTNLGTHGNYGDITYLALSDLIYYSGGN